MPEPRLFQRVTFSGCCVGVVVGLSAESGVVSWVYVVPGAAGEAAWARLKVGPELKYLYE